MNAPATHIQTAVPRTDLAPLDLVTLRSEATRANQRVVDYAIRQYGEDGLAMLGTLLHMRVVDAPTLLSWTPALDVLNFEECLRRECIATRDAAGNLLAVIIDPFNANLADWLGHSFQSSFRTVLTSRDALTAAHARIEESQQMHSGMHGAGGDNAAHAGINSSGEHAEDISARRISEDDSPVVKLVNSTLYESLRQSASDIHIESVAGGLHIKYRIDGVLSRVGSVQGSEVAEQVLSRIKVLAELDIAERRVPQDGRFKANAGDREVDFRVSIMPSIFGEDAVLRVLDKAHLTEEMTGLTLSTLGFDDATRAQIRRLANEPYGMLLVTGPTGSGKTTTLYATIGESNTGLEKIITIEDPVEYQLPGVLQIPVNEKKGLTFSRGLRSILRHDPDKIMVGEIRDSDTAEIAIQAALTGHLVFTTVHANNVFDVIGRFMHMGIDPYNLVAALNVVIAQRLLRVNCTHCRADDVPDQGLIEESALQDTTGFHFKRGTGCSHCRGSGYRGRRAIAEVLPLDDELRELITERAPLRQLKDAAMRKGFKPLRAAGMALVAAGDTTLQELNRVTFIA